MLGHQLAHHLNWAFKIKTFSGSHVQLEGNGVELFLAVRVTEVNGDTGALRDLGVMGHFPPLVIRQGFASGQGHSVQRSAEAFNGCGSRGIAHFCQDQAAAAALYQRTNSGTVVLALDQITFPVTRHFTRVDLGRTPMNADHVGDLATPIHFATARLACCFTLAQAGRVVDRLAADVSIAQIRYIHALELAANLLARQPEVVQLERTPR